MPASAPRCRSVSPTGIVARSSPGDCSNRGAQLSTPTPRANKPPSIRGRQPTPDHGRHRALVTIPIVANPRDFVQSGLYEGALTAGTPGSSARWEPEPPTCLALLPNWVDTVIVPAQTLYVPVIERPSTSIVTECWLRMTLFGGSLMESWAICQPLEALSGPCVASLYASLG